MKAINDKAHFTQLKRAAKERCGVLSTNLVLFSREQLKAIEQDRLYYQEFEQGLVLYADEGDYLRVFYYINPHADLPDMRLEKPIVIEESDANGKRSGYLDSFFPKLEALGWRRIARNVQVSSSLEDRREEIENDYRKAQQNLASRKLVMQLCDRQLAPQVVQLWKESLRITDLPNEHLRFYEDADQQVVVVLDENSLVCGANWWRIRNGMCEIRHSVTKPDHYKQGIGYSMQLAAMNDALSHGCKTVFTYIDDANYRSLAMFEKAGILPNGRISVQYVLD